jgi:hypothetical protein
MKVLRLILVAALLVTLGFACSKKESGGGAGGADFDTCVKAQMDKIQKDSGNPAPPEAKAPAEMACQVCKDQAGSDACKMVIDALK